MRSMTHGAKKPLESAEHHHALSEDSVATLVRLAAALAKIHNRLVSEGYVIEKGVIRKRDDTTHK